MTTRCSAWSHTWDDGTPSVANEVVYTCDKCGVQQKLPTHLVWDPDSDGWADPRPALMSNSQAL